MKRGEKEYLKMKDYQKIIRRCRELNANCDKCKYYVFSSKRKTSLHLCKDVSGGLPTQILYGYKGN